MNKIALAKVSSVKSATFDIDAANDIEFLIGINNLSEVETAVYRLVIATLRQDCNEENQASFNAQAAYNLFMSAADAGMIDDSEEPSDTACELPLHYKIHSILFNAFVQ